MDQSIYYELQAAAERLSPIEDGPAWQALSRMENELDALLPSVLHRRFRRLCDQANAAAPNTARPASSSACAAA